jgi:hypothetical protein
MQDSFAVFSPKFNLFNPSFVIITISPGFTSHSNVPFTESIAQD